LRAGPAGPINNQTSHHRGRRSLGVGDACPPWPQGEEGSFDSTEACEESNVVLAKGKPRPLFASFVPFCFNALVFINNQSLAAEGSSVGDSATNHQLIVEHQRRGFMM
jgi:hypothetical protein